MRLKPPTRIQTVEGETYQVRGEPTLFTDMVEANRRARKVGPGTEVIRSSDGKVVSTSPTFIPSPPRFHD